MFKKVFIFFDRLKNKIRSKLNSHPIIYTLVGGVGVVLFWKGIWDTADFFPFLNGPILIIISLAILLITGLFVSFFIGDRVILSGLKSEKKLTEKTEKEVRAEEQEIREEAVTLQEVKDELQHIDQEVHTLMKDKEKK